MLHKCLAIGSGNDEFSQPTLQSEQQREAVKCMPAKCSNTEDVNEYQKVKEKIDKMEKCYVSQKNRIKSINQQFIDLEKIFVLIRKEKTEKETELKFEEVMNELQAASNFMSQLQTQNGTLAKQVNENEKKFKAMQQKVDFMEEQVFAQFETIDSFDAQSLIDFNEKLSENKVSIEQVMGLTESLNAKVQNLETKFNSIQTGADSVCERVKSLSFNFATSKFSLKNTLMGYGEKTEGLQKKVTDNDGKLADFARQFIDVSPRISTLESTDVPITFDPLELENW